MLRLAFMGTPEFSVPVLAEILGAGHDVAAVYSQPPRPSGRGQQTQPSPVQRFAEGQGIPVRTPRTLRDDEEQAAFAALDLDIAVVVAYGLILPKPILAAPRLGCVNLHASLLPRWRGAAPIQRAIMAGDTETGVMVMQMDAGLDTGPVLMAERTPIGPGMTAGTLHDRLSALGADLMTRALGALERGAIEPMPQAEEGVTYAEKISKEESRIDWTGDAASIDRHIRGLSPVPGAWFEAPCATGEHVRVRILSARPLMGPDAPKGPAGTLVGPDFTVACGDGALVIESVQRAGKGPCAADAFLRGFDFAPGRVMA